MIRTIFVEEEFRNHPRTIRILEKFPHAGVHYLNSYDDVFGRVYKPVSHKQGGLQLFLARKKGKLVREAPPAYGISGVPHYYFIHAYNCIYECEYCFLQGYFSSPDLVLFLNDEEIQNEMQEVLDSHSGEVWFHAGEFSDSLAMAHVLDDWSLYWPFFKKNPRARLEFRTKSANTRGLAKLEALPNVTLSYSLAPEQQAKRFDRKASPLTARLRAMQKMEQRGFRLGIHFDPVIYEENFIENYAGLIDEVLSFTSPEKIEYISIGVVRFSEKQFRQLEKIHPDSWLLRSDYVHSNDGKYKYARPLRMHILHSLESMLHSKGFSARQVYICMEADDLVQSLPVETIKLD